LMLGYAVAAPNLRNYGFQTRQGLALFSLSCCPSL
jgi:hypothetical protein